MQCLLGWLRGVMVTRRTCDRDVVGSTPGRVAIQVTTLGKLFTPMCLCHQAV